MRKVIAFTITMLALCATSFAQTKMKEYKVGHPVTISLPDYMSRAVGLNDAAFLQYQNTVKDIFGVIIEDNKEELVLADLKYASVSEFLEFFLKDFVKDEEKRTVSEIKYQKKGDLNYAECELTFYDKETKQEVYYLISVVETRLAYYKILSCSSLAKKDEFKADFQKIVYSLRD